MADVTCYVVANFDVHDAETYRKYEKGFFPILKKHGGEFVTFDDKTETLEGASPPPGRIVIFRFPSEQAARGWFDDPDYQKLSEQFRNTQDHAGGVKEARRPARQRADDDDTGTTLRPVGSS